VTRSLSLEFTSTDPLGLNPPGWGDTELGGTYRETITGLHRSAIRASGNFRLVRVMSAAALKRMIPNSPTYLSAMKLTQTYTRFLKWLGLVFVAWAASPVAQAQLMPTWTVNYGAAAPPATAHGSFFNRPDLNGLVFVQDTPTINFDWGLSSPDAGIPVNQFSIRWTGRIAPKVSETYTFFATSDDGCRIWVDDQLILDRWFDGATEWQSSGIHLTAGLCL
jgi:hypothetical protein